MEDGTDNRTYKRMVGDIGENIACGFLKKHGYEVIERNYLRKWGEIDIVAKKGSIIHFVEVKTVSRPIEVSRATSALRQSSGQGYRPEDNMHPWKLKRLARTMQTYLLHKKLDCDFQLDLITVKMDMSKRRARVELMENIVI